MKQLVAYDLDGTFAEGNQPIDPETSALLAWLQATLIPLVADVAVRVGGSTSVDVTRKGVDKACGMAKLATAADIPAAKMIFIGDALYPGGNVHAVHEAGIATDRVRDVAETRLFTEAITLFLA